MRSRTAIIILGSTMLVLYCLNTPAAQKKALSRIEQQCIAQGLVDIKDLDPSIQVDLKYSSTENFIGKDVYGDLENCYLQKEVAHKLVKAHKILHSIKPGYNFLVYDGVRPLSVQKIMWQLVKGTPQQRYVANPKYGSIHNYGSAVDLTIVDGNGRVLDMGTPFDYFGDLAQPRYEKKFLKEGKLTPLQVANRRLLRSVMLRAGFSSILTEWWHFNGVSKKQARRTYKIIQ
jgi:zinc D-Ala-D-Ala dipeptidase